MEAEKYIEMLNDKHFFDLIKMSHKYSKQYVSEMLRLLSCGAFKEMPLKDKDEKHLVYIDSKIKDVNQALKSLMSYKGNSPYGLHALEDEIIATLAIEQIDTSRESVRSILAGSAPKDYSEYRILGMKKGFEFIADKTNTINAESMRYLYELMVNPYLEKKEDRLTDQQLYRDNIVYVNDLSKNTILHVGMHHTKLNDSMDELFAFINEKSNMDDLNKAAAIHFQMAYLHPYFDGNGRMARMTHLWYLLQQGYSASLFMPFSSLINTTKTHYYRAFDYTEKNQSISGRLDITPFLSYFAEDVYRQIGEYNLTDHTLDKFQSLLAEGSITEKEKDLFHFVLSRYGKSEFSTKQLEKDFGNCAYATIRSFVMKLTEQGLLEHHSYGNRNKYCIANAELVIQK